MAVRHVPSPRPPRPVGAGDRMVRQVDRERRSSMFPYVDLAAANASAGHGKEAKEAVAQFRKSIRASLSRAAGIHWSDDPTFNAQYQRIVEGLRKAGLPEGEKTEMKRLRERVRCLSLVDWPIYPCLRALWAGQSARAIRGGPEQGPCGGLSPKPPRHWRRRFLVGGRGDVEAAFSPSNAEGQHPPVAPDLAVLGHHRGPCSGFPERTLADRPTARYMLEPPSEGGRMNTVAPIRPVERPTGRLAIRRNAPGAASGRGPPSKSMTRRGGCFVSASAGGKPVAKRRQRPEPNWPASTSG